MLEAEQRKAPYSVIWTITGACRAGGPPLRDLAGVDVPTVGRSSCFIGVLPREFRQMLLLVRLAHSDSAIDYPVIILLLRACTSAATDLCSCSRLHATGWHSPRLGK